MENKKQYADEEKLILLAQSNRKHFKALYEQYFNPIFWFVYKRIGIEAMTADITQQVFVSAMINLPKYQFQGFPFSSWLYKIALNEVNMLYRKTKKQRFVEINDKEMGIFHQEITDHNEEEIFTPELLKELLNLLDEEELTLVQMKYLEGKNYKEIGDILDLSETNAKVKTHRIIKKLREAFNKKQHD